MNLCTGFTNCIIATSTYRSYTFHTTLTLYSYPSMPKIRDSGPKSDTFEIATTQTRRGKRVTHVPVKDSPPSPSPSRSISLSPTKKRAWSPGAHAFNNDYDIVMDPISKRSRTGRKVCKNFHRIRLLSDYLLQTQNEFLQEYLSQRNSILIELLRHESFPSVSICSNCQQVSGTYRCQDCFQSGLGVVLVVFLLMRVCLSIG